MSTSDYWYYTQYASQIDPVTMRVTVTNSGTVPWTKSFTMSPTAPTGTYALASTCPGVLPVGASCAVTVKVRARADSTGTTALVARGAGMGGADVRAVYDLVLRYDDTAPKRVPVPLAPYLDDRYWGAWPDDYQDAETDVATFDVRYRVAVNGGLSSWRYPSAAQGRSLQNEGSWTYSAVPGQQACLSSRARDRAGNVTSWSPAKCTLKLLEDNESSTWSDRWSQHVNNSASWSGGTFLHSAQPGAVFSPDQPVAGTRVALQVKTCPTCGNVNVYIGGTLVGTISTYSAKSAWRVVRTVSYPSTLRGVLRVVSTSTKPVYLDGWAVGVR